MTAANDRNGFDLFHFFLYFFFSSLPAFSSNPVPPPSSARLCRCWEQSALPSLGGLVVSSQAADWAEA